MSRESDGKRVGRGWKVGRESDVRLPRVGDVELGHRGKTRVRAREEPMVRWQRGEGVGHGTSLPGIT